MDLKAVPLPHLRVPHFVTQNLILPVHPFHPRQLIVSACEQQSLYQTGCRAAWYDERSVKYEKKNSVKLVHSRNQGRIQTFPMGRVLAGVSVLRVGFITYFDKVAVFFVQFFCVVVHSWAEKYSKSSLRVGKENKAFTQTSSFLDPYDFRPVKLQ